MAVTPQQAEAPGVHDPAEAESQISVPIHNCSAPGASQFSSQGVTASPSPLGLRTTALSLLIAPAPGLWHKPCPLPEPRPPQSAGLCLCSQPGSVSLNIQM